MENPIEYEEIPEDAEDQCVPSDKQRLRIHVPYKNTTLTMGEKADDQAIRDEDRGDLNFPGFGATTQGHVFLDANGEAADSMMRLQSKGHLTVQTPSKLAAGGKEGTILASDLSTVVAGGGGVSIFGGAALPWTDNQVNDATSPDSPGWISNIQTSTDDWSNFWLVMDAAVAGIGLAQQFSAESVASAGNHWISTHVLGGALSIVNSIAAMAGLKDTGLEHVLTPPSGTTVHGSGGLILGSGAFASLHSLLGTAIASPASVSVMAGLAADIFGRVNASLSSSKLTSVASGGSVGVVAHDQTVVTARKGASIIGGKSVHVGIPIEVDLGSAEQEATESVLIDAVDRVEASADHVALTGETAVSLGGGAAVNIGADEVKIAGADGLVSLKSGEATIGIAQSAPDLSQLKDLRKALADAYTDYCAALRTALEKEDDYGKNTNEINEQALKLATARVEKASELVDKLESEISALQMDTKNSITFKSDGIEIVFKGTKFKLDDSGVKSGPIKWKSS